MSERHVVDSIIIQMYGWVIDEERNARQVSGITFADIQAIRHLYRDVECRGVREASIAEMVGPVPASACIQIDTRCRRPLAQTSSGVRFPEIQLMSMESVAYSTLSGRK